LIIKANKKELKFEDFWSYGNWSSEVVTKKIEKEWTKEANK
jgi:hypothetical protein